jgi:LysR family cys regulon transcriptional activator
VCDYVLAGEADLAIATEAIGEQEDLVMLPCYQWNRCVIARPEHPILKAKPLTLEAIAKYPIVTYDFAFTGRSQINKAFAARGLDAERGADGHRRRHHQDLRGTWDSASASSPTWLSTRRRTRDLRAVDAAHLFESATTRIGIRRNAWLRGYVYTFIELFAPHLTRRMVHGGAGGRRRK